MPEFNSIPKQPIPRPEEIERAMLLAERLRNKAYADGFDWLVTRSSAAGQSVRQAVTSAVGKLVRQPQPVGLPRNGQLK